MLYIMPNLSIMDVKWMVELRTGIPIDQQRLVFAGQHLRSSKTVDHYELQTESTLLHLTLRMRGS